MVLGVRLEAEVQSAGVGALRDTITNEVHPKGGMAGIAALHGFRKAGIECGKVLLFDGLADGNQMGALEGL